MLCSRCCCLPIASAQAVPPLLLVPQPGTPTVPHRSRVSTVWNWLKDNPVQVLLLASLLCAAETGAVVLALQVHRARLGPNETHGQTQPVASKLQTVPQTETTPIPRVSKPLVFSGSSAGLAFSSDGERLTSGSAIWSALNGTLLVKTGAKARNGRPAFNPDGNSIANGLEILDAHDGTHMTLIDPDFAGKKVYGVAFSPDGKRFAAGKGDWGTGDVKIFNLPGGETTETFTNNAYPVWDVAFSPDGKSLATASGRWQDMKSGGGPGEARLWNISSGKSNQVHESRFPFYTIAFSGDGRRIAAGGGAYHVAFKSAERGEMTVWDVPSGAEVLSMMRLPSCVYSVALSPDGKQLVAGTGEEGEQGPFEVKLWDVESGQEILTLGRHKKSVRGVAFSADGKRVASGSTDGVIQIWNLE
jgi:WD40 repeat protein